MHRRQFYACCAVGAMSLTNHCAFSADDGKWGNLTATFLYDGEPPPRQELTIDKDKGYYKDPIYDESLVVDPKSKGIANVVVWLHLSKDDPPPVIHESYAKLTKEDVVVETL